MSKKGRKSKVPKVAKEEQEEKNFSDSNRQKNGICCDVCRSNEHTTTFHQIEVVDRQVWSACIYCGENNHTSEEHEGEILTYLKRKQEDPKKEAKPCIHCGMMTHSSFFHESLLERLEEAVDFSEQLALDAEGDAGQSADESVKKDQEATPLLLSMAFALLFKEYPELFVLAIEAQRILSFSEEPIRVQ